MLLNMKIWLPQYWMYCFSIHGSLYPYCSFVGYDIIAKWYNYMKLCRWLNCYISIVSKSVDLYSKGFSIAIRHFIGDTKVWASSVYVETRFNLVTHVMSVYVYWALMHTCVLTYGHRLIIMISAWVNRHLWSGRLWIVFY